MGFISFIKDAGAKVFGIGKTSAEEAAEVAAEHAMEVRTENQRAGQHMINTITDLGFEVSDLFVSVDGDTATVHGMAKDQETREKVILVVGNSAGIAGVEDLMTVEVAAPQATFHTVERGDSLSKIAKAVYGDAMKYPVIFEANQPMLTHPDKIYPGQVLRIPVLDQ